MINYKILNDSIEYYEKAGFQRIETPWAITKAISDITKPKGAGDFTIAEKNKVLVASAEQGFLYLYNKGFLPKGRWQSISPCFRDESFDLLHTKYFMKNELIITDNVCNEQLGFVVKCARDFFRKYCLGLPILHPVSVGYVDDVLIVDTVNGKDVVVSDEDIMSETYKYQSYDLTFRGIELGSYGIRDCGIMKYIYGTGVALPRLTRAISIVSS